ncbi:AAA family ATPase [Priestia megaterium]|uniref:AAA family ATPase n=1 Tax=Priestia megaterium TaxID=1404 RepID=UPI003EDF2DD9
MKIRKIIIKDFKAIRNIEMDEIPDFVVIAGPNGVGKSTLFEAIKTFQGIAKRIYIDNLRAEGRMRNSMFSFNREEHTGEIEITFELSNEERDFLETDKTLVSGRINFNDRQDCMVDNDLGKLLVEGNSFSQINHIKANRTLASKLNKNINLSSLSRFFDEDTTVGYSSKEKNVMSFEKVKDYLTAIYFDDLIKIAEDGSEGNELHELVQIINSYIKPKKFLGVKRDSTGLTFPVENGDIKHDIDELSSGEKEIVMLFVNLKWIQAKSYIFLYDEPELHLNANLEKLMTAHLKQLQGNNQIWLNTHSYEILDSANFKDIYQIVYYSGENQIYKLISQEDKFETFKSLGANVGLQLISEKVIFVEGKTDKEFFQLLFDEYKDQINFVQSTGINNLMRVSNAVVDLLTEASKASDFYLVRDKDFLFNPQIEELKAKFNQRIHVLPKYHIENYFLNGEAIYLVMKNMGIDVFDSPIQIDDRLKSIADSQKNDIIAKSIASQLHDELRKFDFKVGGENLEQRLIERISSQKERINEILDEHSIRSLITERTQYVEEQWGLIWRDFPPGRDILKQFVKDFVDGIKYDRFIHLLVRQSIELKIDEIEKLKSTILEDIGIECE